MVMPARICTHWRNNACMHICTHGHNHACKNMYTCTQSFPHVYTHMGAIMPARICTHAHNSFAHIHPHTHTQMREHVHICMHTHVQSCVHVPGRGVIFAVHAMIRSGLEHHVFLSTFSSELFICALPGGSSRNPWRHRLASALLLFPCCLC